MPKRTSVADAIPIRVVIVTLDDHLASATERAAGALAAELPGLRLTLHAAAEWSENADALARCLSDIAEGDIVVANMLFMEEHIKPVAEALAARRSRCDAMVCSMSAPEVVRLTRLGRFDMQAGTSGPLALLKRLRGSQKPGGKAPGAQQLTMLRLLPRILRFVPGTAQDMRAYFLALQYWIAGSDENVANLVRLLVDRYADGPRRALRGKLSIGQPAEYPDVGVYHPRLRGRIADRAERLPAPSGSGHAGTVGLLVMRSYVLAGNTAHYDGVIDALEARGLRVIPAFSSGLDARPAVERFFKHGGRAGVDAIVSLTGFSLVGGPAYNDAAAAERMLADLDVPYIAAQPLEFQTMEQWAASERGLMPVEATMMVAIPELDGSTGPIVFGGRTGGSTSRDMQPHPERISMLAARVARLVALRRAERAERRIAIVLFNFPPNSGSTGTAAYLDVFESLHRVLVELADGGYRVDVPPDSATLRDRILGGNSGRYGSDANVHARVPTDDHVRRERWLAQIEAQWGPAPGRHQADGGGIHILGERFGNVFVGIQPAFGYEGDPMRLLFERGFAPTHAFSAFYRYLKEDFGAHAVLHFGTHGALEFMPGKQAGLSGDCWPDRLVGDLPNVYLYASNNPAEGALAKRRAAATLVSYLTPSLTHAGLYRGLADLKASVERWRSDPAKDPDTRRDLAALIQAHAATLDLAVAEPPWKEDAEEAVQKVGQAILELEHTLIPDGLHVIGAAPDPDRRVELLAAMAEANSAARPALEDVQALVAGSPVETVAAARGYAPGSAEYEGLAELARIDALLRDNQELVGLVRALDGRYVPPVPGGDLLRTPSVLPTGRNVHGFDPFRIPSAFACAEGARQAGQLLARHQADGRPAPETVAIVLWGTDNLKTEGSPLAQTLALMGARPRFDAYGRLCGAELLPLAELGRPRIDVVVTVSGIFRDLLPLQTRVLAEAAYLAASADEPVEWNFVRKHALAHCAEHGSDLETAALRVFSNADGAYGSNVGNLVHSGNWNDEDQLAETFSRRKCFAYGRNGRPVRQPELLRSVLAKVDLAYQNLDSVELGVTTIDHYFDTLGGISRAVRRASGDETLPVYIGDATTGRGTVRTLAEQVALETHTRMLNPKWYEGQLRHGHEGVRQIELHVTNTMGWSATTGAVAPWVYEKLTQVYVLDKDMRRRLAALNPLASSRMANRLLEAHQRRYWNPDPETLSALQQAGEELEDRLEGIPEQAVA